MNEELTGFLFASIWAFGFFSIYLEHQPEIIE